MRKSYLAAALIAASPALSQQTVAPPASFSVMQSCYPAQQFLAETTITLGESALIQGYTLTRGSDGNSYTGPMLMFVNQDTGTWTLATMYGNGMVCIDAWGDGFQPYIPE